MSGWRNRAEKWICIGTIAFIALDCLTTLAGVAWLLSGGLR